MLLVLLKNKLHYEKENLIDDSWTYVDLIEEIDSLFGDALAYNYVYRDFDDNYNIIY